MFLEFPFEYANLPDLGKLFYPIVKLSIRTTFGWKEFEFLVDTGADITTIPAHLLPVLGLDRDKLKIDFVLGVGGISVKTWNFKLPIQIGDRRLEIACSAVDNKHDSLPLLLGRKDIFEDKLNLIIDSARKVTVLKWNH